MRKHPGAMPVLAPCSRGFSCFFILYTRIPRPVQEQSRPVCIATPASNVQGGRGLRRTKLCFPLLLSLLQNRRTTTSDFVVFVVFVGIRIWYTFVFRLSFYIGWGRAGRACPVGSFAKQITFVSRLSSLVGAVGLAPFPPSPLLRKPRRPPLLSVLHNFPFESLV